MPWKAPTGDEIRGTVASTPGACFVNWHGEGAPVDGFDHNGTEHFYDDQDEMKIDAVPLFLDDSGHKWLQHHLIPANAGGRRSSRADDRKGSGMSWKLLGYALALSGLALFALSYLVWRHNRPNSYHRFVQRSSRRGLEQMRPMSAPAVISYMRKMNPHAVEEIVLDAAEAAGHDVRRNRAYTGDGGVDGQIRVDGVWCLVQVKRHRDTIKPQHVAEFSALCASRGQPGLFVHCGRTGDKSRQSMSAGVRLVSGESLVALIKGRSLNQGIGRRAA